ncbi:MAG: T9SS type A sorting domain-containing protein [Bacteroidota bacterium]|nr:T9SS type A sorting domain-containing protein [Bacteroidota bacterium]
MKKQILYLLKISVLMLLSLSIKNNIFSHEHPVHEYIVLQAYELLKMKYPSIVTKSLHSHIGTLGSGCSGPYFQSELISVGARREDCEDIVYGYDNEIIKYCPTLTHFWDADAGDNSTFYYLLQNNPNSYQKVLKYILPGKYGRWDSRKIWTSPGSWDPRNPNAWPCGGNPMFGVVIQYDNLIDFYKTGNAMYIGWLDLTLEIQRCTNPQPVTIGEPLRSQIVFETLGRIAHSIGDMGVPAHVHNDAHGPFPISRDETFETEMKIRYNGWTASNAYNQGGILDIYNAVPSHDYSRIMRYLMYTTNQIADRFPSDLKDGDANYSTTYNGDDYSVLNIISNITAPYVHNDGVFYPEAADYAFVFSIRAVAGLLYWFAVETCMLPYTPSTPTLASPNNNATCIPNSITLSWNRADRCPTSYHLQVATNSAFSAIFYENSSITGISQTVNSLSNNTTYYWRVRAINSTGNSNWSSTYSFQTKTPPYAYSLWADKFEIYRNETATITLNVTPLNCIERYAWGHSCSAPTSQYEFVSYTTSNKAFIKNFGVEYEHQTYYVGATAYIDPWQSGAELPIQIILKVGDRPPPPPPPSCPYVYTWDSTQFHEDNNILPQSEYPGNEGKDVIDFYRLIKPLRIDNGKYILQIREFENERSFFDHFTLLTVDHPNSTKIDVSELGEIYQYITPHTLKQAKLNRNDIFNQILSFDGNNVIVNRNDTMFLSISNPQLSKEVASLQGTFFGTEASAAALPKVNKIAYIANTQTDADYDPILTFRQRPTLRFVPMTLKNPNNWKIVWCQKASVDYINFGLRIQPGYQMKKLPITSAIHSTYGDITTKLRKDDSLYTTLEPGQSIILSFSAIEFPPVSMSRSYILISKGRYEKGYKQFPSPENLMVSSSMIKEFSLNQNYPEPFNASTSIQFELPIDCDVKLTIFDILGKIVTTVINEYKTKGQYSVNFDADQLPSGVYIYRLQADKYSNTKKMLLLK